MSKPEASLSIFLDMVRWIASQNLKLPEKVSENANTALPNSDVSSFYPVNEAQWLVSRAWNLGVAQFRAQNLILCEKFMMCALQLFKLLLEKKFPSQGTMMSKSYAYVVEQLQTESKKNNK